jgi:purine-binding chemotaxis protein CheW
MSASRAEYLLVRAGSRLVGLSLDQVIEVMDVGEILAVPTLDPAVRGVTRVRGRIMPLVHLGALLDGTACPQQRGDTAVVVELSGRRVCLEVEAAETVLHDAGLPISTEAAMPWAVAVARTEGGVLPLLDLAEFGTRITEGPTP